MPDLHLTLTRTHESEECVLGELTANGQPFCYTLERPRTGDHPCIPEGVYKVVVDFSNRFQRRMPHVLDVPGREGIRIHPGNLASDSEGCILVGFKQTRNSVLRSRDAYLALMERLDRATAITLEIKKAV